MRWTKTNYPVQMNNLHEDVRKRAVDIANQLVEEGMNENEAILTAIDRAEAWTHHRNDPSRINEGRSNYMDNTEKP